jgi:central kinetochore subunit Mis15/CHL4
MPPLSVPTTAALSSTQLIPSQHPAVIKTLNRLSRPSLLTLVLDWLDDRNAPITNPLLLEEVEEPDEQDFYPLAPSLEALREIYTDLQARKGGKRDVVDRIVEGDWRDGLSLYQLAMADMQYLYDHPTSQKWTALKIVRIENEEQKKSLPCMPRFHPAIFLQNLQKEALPDVKAHYNLDRHETLPLMILRIFVLESPYNTSLALKSTAQRSLFDQSKTFYVAFPDSSPYVYVSLTTSIPAGAPGPSPENKSARNQILGGIPKAFSKPRERYKLETTSLSARNLEALVEKRGGGRTNAAGGGWGIYTEEHKGKDNPLNIQLPTPQSLTHESTDHDSPEGGESGMKRKREEDEVTVKRRKRVAQGRFGNSAKADDGKGIERLDIFIQDPYPSAQTEETLDMEDEEPRDRTKTKHKGRRSMLDTELSHQEDDDDVRSEGWKPDVRITFHGQHVFAGIRELVEAGVIDGEKMPGWMTGEEGVSVGVVRDGRIKGFKGSGT